MYHLKTILAFVSLAIVGISTAFALQSADQQTQLAAIQRQIELIQQSIHSMPKGIDSATRYHFDYQRMNADLELIRSGIRDYLVPRRAQPRDPVEVQGNYQQETRKAP